MRRGITAEIRAALAEGLDTAPAIAKRVGVSGDQASSLLNGLAEAGTVMRVGERPQAGTRPLVLWALAPEVYAERAPALRDLPPLPDLGAMSLTARLLGDPAPGRSALDARGMR